MKFLYGLLMLVPATGLLWFFDVGHTWIFLSSAGALVPLAALMSNATELVGEHTSPRIGALLNATFGNMAELIITVVALQSGLLQLVKASISGSIIGTSLLIMGSSMLVGGIKNGQQTFNARIAGATATMMMLSVVALLVPGLFSLGSSKIVGDSLEHLSLGMAVVLLVLYGLYILYTIFLQPPASQAARKAMPKHGMWYAIGLLTGATVGVAAMSELFVNNVEPVIRSWGVTELFLGVILVPIVGNVAEQYVAIQTALDNEMDASVGISLGSGIQIALFVAPILVFASLLFGQHLTLLFNGYELAALAGAAVISTLIAVDGESNWLEGAQLLGVYLILAIGFFYLK